MIGVASTGAAVIRVPVAGGLPVGLIACFGSQKVRGHGIPEAILFGKSCMSPKVAVLEPLSSGIVIGSGSAFGSLIAQCFHLSAAERKTAPVAAVLLAVELLLFEWRPRSFLPVALACAVAGFARVPSFGSAPLFPLTTAAPSTVSLAICRLVAARLADTGLERRPVNDDPVSRRLIGIVSRSDLVKPAQRHADQEQRHERFHGWPALRRARRLADDR